MPDYEALILQRQDEIMYAENCDGYCENCYLGVLIDSSDEPYYGCIYDDLFKED